MIKSIMPLIIFCFISISIAYLSHKKINNFFLASLWAAIISSILYQLIGFIILGYLDPFYLIALAGGVVIAFLIALLIGIPVVHNRKKQRGEAE